MGDGDRPAAKGCRFGMNRLARRIAATIAASGPISVADYMATCLFDPQDGYYATREPFGVAGDFTTAPEISQMFGEIVAVFLLSAWRGAGSPSPLALAEIGPGRGTLMQDMLRTLARVSPDLLQGATVALVESSPRLTEVQRKTLSAAAAQPEWHDRIGTLAKQPLFIVGNELFDAIPTRQYVKTPSGWHERMVALDADGRLVFVAGPGAPDPSLLPPGWKSAPENAIAEIAPTRSALIDEIAARIAKSGGVGLFIDYGHAESGLGDTLQAVRAHAYDGVLDHPGEADLTSHVDFAALASEARRHGLETGLLTQGDFLLRMGLLERAGRLGQNAAEPQRDAIRAAVERLAGPEQMGRLFKVLCIAPRGLLPFPFVASD